MKLLKSMRLIKKCKDGNYLEGVTVTGKAEGGESIQNSFGNDTIQDKSFLDKIANKLVDYGLRRHSLSDDTIRARLYRNIIPVYYDNAYSRVRNAVFRNKKETFEDDILPKLPRRARESNMFHDPQPYIKNIWGHYLGFDNVGNINQVVPSKYRPTKGDASNVQYMAVKNAMEDSNNSLSDRMFKLTRFLKKPGDKRQAVSNMFGRFTVNRGRDEKGDYLSYYDLWDLSPYGMFGHKDQSNGIGKPIHFYDRIYFDDYYGVNNPDKATYLPEVIIGPEKYKQDGVYKLE